MRLASIILVTVIAVCTGAFAQQDQGNITGTITDSTGAVIPGASITAREISTNVTLRSSSNESGVYVVGPLKIGTYELSVESDGFKRSVRAGVEIHAGDRIGLDFELEVGDLVEVVTVEGTTPVLKTENATLDYTVERKQLEDFPLNGRSYQSLGLLSAGVAPEIGGRDRGPLGTSSFGNGLSVNGQPALQNNYLIDGVDNNSTVMGLQDRKSQAVIPSLDAVQEMKVQTSNYSAEYGRNAGGVIMVSIRGGTNEFHGSAYEFIRNDVFDARPAFGRNDRDGDGKADPAVLRQNQWGGTFGGPIVKNKAFFFGSVETWNVRRAQSDLVVVPTALERAGDFSQTAGLARLLDPNTSSVPAERAEFPNKAIPNNYAMRDPVGVALAGSVPGTKPLRPRHSQQLHQRRALDDRPRAVRLPLRPDRLREGQSLRALQHVHVRPESRRAAAGHRARRRGQRPRPRRQRRLALGDLGNACVQSLRHQRIPLRAQILGREQGHRFQCAAGGPRPAVRAARRGHV